MVATVTMAVHTCYGKPQRAHRRAAPPCQRRRFADGFPNLFVKDAIRIRNRHVAFLASFHSPGVIFEQVGGG